MFGKIMTGVILRDEKTLALRIAEVEKEFSRAIELERAGEYRLANKALGTALELEARAFN